MGSVWIKHPVKHPIWISTQYLGEIRLCAEVQIDAQVFLKDQLKLTAC